MDNEEFGFQDVPDGAEGVYFAAVPSNSRLRRRQGQRGSFYESEKHLLYIFCFWAVSFGYMCAWTSFGSLISYYKHHFGSNFYTQIYCAYYLPGLPVCLFQYKYDTFFDVKHGSHHTYLLRGVFYISIMIFIIISMILLEDKTLLILCFAGLGICSWATHGTASTLAALYSTSCITALQTGFRSPEVFVFLLTMGLDIGSTPNFFHLAQFYTLTAVGVAVGLLCWIILCTNKVALDYFYEIDKEYRAIYPDSAEKALGNSSSALIATIIDGLFFRDTGVQPHIDRSSSASVLTKEPAGDWFSKYSRWFSSSKPSRDHFTIYSRHRYVDNNYFLETSPLLGEAAGGILNGFPRYTNPSERANYVIQVDADMPVTIAVTADKGDTSERDDGSGGDEDGDELDGEQEGGDNTSIGSNSLIDSLSSISRGEIDIPSFLIDNITREGGPKLLPQTYSLQSVRQDVMLLCNTLFVTMFTSIFQGAFFVYAKSLSSRNIEQYLYFTRLFGDLLGRPLASLPRPWFLRTDIQLWKGVLWRLILLFTFFLYIFLPESWIPRNDFFVCSIVGIFSVSNGYFAVLIYEYAAERVKNKGKNAQAFATTLLNIAFQLSCFLAVVSSVSIVALIGQ